jgi:hypothetical protein
MDRSDAGALRRHKLGTSLVESDVTRSLAADRRMQSTFFAEDFLVRRPVSNVKNSGPELLA